MSSLYSQGFNFSSSLERGVNPRTGQYEINIDIYQTPSHVRNCAPFKLSMTFNPLNAQDIGLGQGWTFNLPFYDHRPARGTLLMSTGESFRTTETSVNVFVTDQKLKSSQFKKLQGGLYQITYKSAQVEILSNANNTYNKSVLVELYSHVGRSLLFKWARFGEQPRLQRIQQGNEVLLEINYEAFQTVITRAPGTSEACALTLVQRNNQLTELRLPVSGAPPWSFAYQRLGQMGYLSTVTSPSGSTEEIRHREQGHLLPTGAPVQSIPYVISHTKRPGVGQPPILTTYSYSDRNFLGFNGSHNWRDGEDNLFLTPNDYQYSSTVLIEGGTTTTHTYNKFHLLVSSEQQKGSKRVTEITTYHALPNSGFDAQPAQYQLPKTVETIYEDRASNTSRMETSHHVFDEWGNPTEDIEANGVKTTRTYYPPDGEKGSDSIANCPSDPHGFQRYVKSETVTPAASDVSTPTRSESYTYGQVPTLSGSKATYFIAVRRRQSLENSQALTTSDYTYVDQPTSNHHGRLQREVTHLRGEYPTTKHWAYDNPNDTQLKQTMTTVSFDGFSVDEETVYSLWSGMTLSNKNAAGVVEKMAYDTIGRLIKIVTSHGSPYETVLQHDYCILEGSSGSQKTVTDTKGTQTRYITDGLDRLCRVEHQDPQQDTFFVVQEKSYNAQDQLTVIEETEWLSSEGGIEATKQRSSRTMEYDDWGNVSRVTESSGVITLSTIDPITMTSSEGIEGEGTVKARWNAFGALTERALHHSGPDSKLYSKVTYTYDGLGRLASQIDYLGRRTEFRYDPFDRIVETVWPNDRVIKTGYAHHTTAVLPTSMNLGNTSIGVQTFDGLGRLKTKEAGGRTMKQYYEGISPAPCEVINPKEEKLTIDFIPALDYAPMRITTDAHSDGYRYDPKLGALSQSEDLHAVRHLHYLPSGPLSHETIKRTGGRIFSTNHVRSLSGKLQEYTDVHGRKHLITYDEHGRLQKQTMGDLNVSLVYDKASRVSEFAVEDAAKQTKFISRLTYDDFGREIKRSVMTGDDTPVYDLTLTYNELGLITKRLQKKEQDVLRNEDFAYDVHNRLIRYDCRGSKAPTDDKGKPLKRQEFTYDEHDNICKYETEFQDGSNNIAVCFYGAQDPNQITQITNTHPDFTTEAVIKFNANGCLTQDERGQRLEYDSMSRLTTVRDSNDQILSRYRYDAEGRLVCQQIPNLPDTNLFYRGDSLIAVERGDEKTSFLFDGAHYWGEAKSLMSGDATTKIQLWALDSQNSVLAVLDTQEPEQTHYQQYTPYSFLSSGSEPSSIGFNGQWRDPVTGWYHMGNGYRVYNPVLMRFHTPDPWSPFTSGEMNPYTYCLGDPINRADPSGQFSLFGGRFTLRDLVMTVIGIATSVAAGVLTGGASLAIQIGVGIAVGVATDIVSGMIGDVVEGNPITLKSIGMDALGGLVGGVAGTAGGQALKSGFQAVRAAPMAVAKAVGRAGSYSVTNSLENAVRRSVLASMKSNLRSAARGFIPSQAAANGVARAITEAQDSKQTDSQQATQASSSNDGDYAFSSNPLGRHGPAQVGAQQFYLESASSKATDIIRPAMKEGDVIMKGSVMSSLDSMSISNYDTEIGLGQAGVSEILNQDTRVSFQMSAPNPKIL